MKFASLLVCVLLAAQTGAPVLPAIGVYYRLPGASSTPYRWVIVDPPISLTVDAAGTPHLGATSGYTDDGNLTVSSYRTGPPAGPGTCTDGFGIGPRGWATDAAYIYVCVPAASPATGFIWARAPLVTTW